MRVIKRIPKQNNGTFVLARQVMKRVRKNALSNTSNQSK